MNFLRKHKNICSAVAALMVAVLVVYSFGSFRSYAAAPEVSTLPADIDIDVDYTADTVNFTYAGHSYSIDRKHNVNLIHYSYRGGRYQRDYNQPETFECSFAGDLCYTSYWFSPSELRIYVLMTPSLRKVSQVKSYLASSNYGTFLLVDARYSDTGFNSVFMTTIDYSSGSAVYNVMSSQEGISSWDANSSNTKKYDDVYACASNINYFNFYWTGYLYNNYLVRAGLDYKATGELNTSDYASNYHYIPNDLLCIFSNYEISGFYEPDTSKVSTPDYYFNYQYIFYKKGYGYIFIDSAKRCKEVGFPNGVTNPRFYFDAEGNNYVYTSVDGITWILKSAYNTMYNKYFEVSCGYEFTDYTLVYTNDKNFDGDPLVTPSYGNITDVTDNLNSFLNDYNIISTSGRGGSLNSFDYAVVEYPENNSFFGAFMGTLTMKSVKYCVYENITSKGSGRFSDYIHVYYFASDAAPYITIDYPTDSSGITAKDPLISMIYSNSSLADCTYSLLSTTEVPTLSMYLRLLNNATLNIDTKLSALRTDLHTDLKSVFTNITLTNQYLKRISDNLDSLSIPAAAPDYSGNFAKLSAALDKLHNDLIYEEGVTKLPNVPQYLVYVYSVTKDIRTKLDTIISKMPAGSGSVDVDTDSIVTAINESATSLTATVDSGTDKLHSDLNYIKALMTIDTVNKLFGDDNDSQNIFNFVSKGIASIVSGSIISDALAFSTQTKDGIVYISSYVNKFYDAVPVYSSIVTVGASFFIIDMVLRRKS